MSVHQSKNVFDINNISSQNLISVSHVIISQMFINQKISLSFSESKAMRFSNCQALPLVIGSISQTELPIAILFAIGKRAEMSSDIQMSSLNLKKVLF